MPFLSLEDFAPGGRLATSKEFDFIIVGAGTAGCPLASRLSEDPSVKVLLIESGPKDHALEDRINKTIPVAVAKLQHSPYDWEYYAEPQLPNACTRINTYEGAKPETNCRSFWPRGKGLGGSSCINYMAWVRGHPNDYDSWESKHGAKGWGWKDIGSLFRDRIENVSECDPKHVPSAGHGSTGCYGISTRNPLSSLAVQFVNACEAVGFKAGDYNYCPTAGKSSHNGIGVAGVMQQTVRRGTRCDAARVYIDPLLRGGGNRRPNLFVLAGTTCESLILEKQDGILSVKGVHLVPDRGPQGLMASLDLHASKEVILSAGALGSPQILLKSGIGPDGETLSLSQVGRNMLDHPTAFLRFPPKLGQGKQDIGSMNSSKAEGLAVFLPNILNMLLGGKGVLTSCCYDATLFYSSNAKNGSETASPNLQVGFFAATADKGLAQNNLGMNFDDMMVDPAEWRPNAEGVHFVCTLLQPKSTGTLSISSDRKSNNGLTILPEYFTDKGDLDMKNVIDCMRTAIRIAQSVPFQDLLSPTPCWPKDLCDQYNVPHISDPSPPTSILGADDYPTGFLEEYIRRYATTLYHPTSTCRMGRNSNIGVVDYSLKVFGVKGLRVADASIQPQIVSGNTQASCVAIGEKAADIIREEYGLVSHSEELLNAIYEYERRGQLRVTATMTLAVTMPLLLMVGLVSRGWKSKSL